MFSRTNYFKSFSAPGGIFRNFLLKNWTTIIEENYPMSTFLQEILQIMFLNWYLKYPNVIFEYHPKSCLILTLKVVNGFVHPTISHHIIMFWCKRKKKSIKKEFPTLPIQGINNHPFIIFQIKAWKTLKKKQNKKPHHTN